MEIKCLNCGKLFEKTKSGDGGYFCSEKCINEKADKIKTESLSKLCDPDIDYMSDKFSNHIWHSIKNSTKGGTNE
jgi:hypothetical protein